MADEEIPPGFQRISGRKKPPVGWRGYIALRCGFVDTRVAYEREQLVWQHDGGPGDIIAVCTIGDSASEGAAWNPKSGGY